MEDPVRKLIDSIIDQAIANARTLAEQLKKEGQIELPQVLAESEWINDNKNVFDVAIVLNLSKTDTGRQMGQTSLEFYTMYDGKLVSDNYIAGLFSPFTDTVSSPEFRNETERFVNRLTADDGWGMITRISEMGTFAIQSFIVPENTQMKVLTLPKDCSLSVGGMVFEGIDEIQNYVYTQTESSQPYIIERSQLFPCFDYEDFANENRYFRNFLICRSMQEANEKNMKMKLLNEGNNFNLVNNDLPADMRPMVYYRDESASMILAF